MDNFTKSMAGTAVGLGSVALIGEGIKMTKKPSTKKIIRAGTNTMVGIALLGAVSKSI